MLHVVTFPILIVLFCDQDWQGKVFKVMKNSHSFSVFSHMGSFPQVFGHVNPIQDGGRGGAKRPPTSFFSVTSANVEIIPKIFLTFSINHFTTLV